MTDLPRNEVSTQTPDASTDCRPLFSVVVPVFDSLPYLSDCIDSILTAALRVPDMVEIIAVDNGSTDGSYELLDTTNASLLRLKRFDRRNIAAVRNFGASSARGTYLCFLDSDVMISPDYFDQARDALTASGADATGCEVMLPSPASWVEETWGALHRPARDSFVHYVNSANFIVSAVAFRTIGGFDESLTTGEDAEIGQRLGRHGYRIFQSRRVSAVHLRNPTTAAAFFRKQLWHGQGALGTVTRSSIDKPFAMTVVHAALAMAGLAGLFVPIAPVAARLGFALACTLFSPGAAVAYRFATFGPHPTRIAKALVLYHLYFDARAVSLARIAFARRRPSTPSGTRTTHSA